MVEKDMTGIKGDFSRGTLQVTSRVQKMPPSRQGHNGIGPAAVWPPIVSLFWDDSSIRSKDRAGGPCWFIPQSMELQTQKENEKVRLLFPSDFAWQPPPARGAAGRTPQGGNAPFCLRSPLTSPNRGRPRGGGCRGALPRGGSRAERREAPLPPSWQGEGGVRPPSALRDCARLPPRAEPRAHAEARRTSRRQ